MDNLHIKLIQQTFPHELSCSQYNSHSSFSGIRFAIQFSGAVPADALNSAIFSPTFYFVSKRLEAIENKLWNFERWIFLIVKGIGIELMVKARTVYWII